MSWPTTAELRSRGRHHQHAYPQLPTSWNVVERLLDSRGLKQSDPATQVRPGLYHIPVEDKVTRESRGVRVATLKNNRWEITK